MPRREQIGHTVRKPDCTHTHTKKTCTAEGIKRISQLRRIIQIVFAPDKTVSGQSTKCSSVSMGCSVWILHYASLSLLCFLPELFNKSSRATQSDDALWTVISPSFLHLPNRDAYRMLSVSEWIWTTPCIVGKWTENLGWWWRMPTVIAVEIRDAPWALSHRVVLGFQVSCQARVMLYLWRGWRSPERVQRQRSFLQCVSCLSLL